MTYRARGSDDASFRISISDILSYRSAYSTPMPDFDFDAIMTAANAKANAGAAPKLVMSETGFKHVDHNSLSESEQYIRKIKSLLNKMTAENIEPLCTELLTDELFEGNHLDVVIGHLFEKTVEEPFFISVYIQLVMRLYKYDVARASGNVQEKNSHVRKSLIEKSQHLFTSIHARLEDKNMDSDEMDRARHRGLNNMNFLAELFNKELLSWKVLGIICDMLLKEPFDDAKVETLLRLIEGCGQLVDEKNPTLSGKNNAVFPTFASVFAVIQKIGGVERLPTVSNRVWFAAQDLVALRERKWQKREIAGLSVPLAEDVVVATPTTASSSPTGHPPSYRDNKPKDEASLKRLKEALPPTVLTPEVRKKLTTFAAKAVLSPAASWESVFAECGALLKEKMPFVLRTNVAFVLAKKACMQRDEEQRSAIAEAFASATFPDKKEVARAFAWVLSDAIVNGEKEDCPFFFKHFGQLAFLSLKDPKTVLRDFFIKAWGHLDVLYADEGGDNTWDKQALELWENYWGHVLAAGSGAAAAAAASPPLSAADAVRGGSPSNSTTSSPASAFCTGSVLLDALAAGTNPFVLRIASDMVSDYIYKFKFCTPEAVGDWIEANAKNDKAQSLIGEIELII